MSSEPNANLSEPGTAANLAAASNDNYNHVTRVEDSQVGPGHHVQNSPSSNRTAGSINSSRPANSLQGSHHSLQGINRSNRIWQAAVPEGEDPLQHTLGPAGGDAHESSHMFAMPSFQMLPGTGAGPQVVLAASLPLPAVLSGVSSSDVLSEPPEPMFLPGGGTTPRAGMRLVPTPGANNRGPLQDSGNSYFFSGSTSSNSYRNSNRSVAHSSGVNNTNHDEVLLHDMQQFIGMLPELMSGLPGRLMQGSSPDRAGTGSSMSSSSMASSSSHPLPGGVSAGMLQIPGPLQMWQWPGAARCSPLDLPGSHDARAEQTGRGAAAAAGGGGGGAASHQLHQASASQPRASTADRSLATARLETLQFLRTGGERHILQARRRRQGGSGSNGSINVFSSSSSSATREQPPFTFTAAPVAPAVAAASATAQGVTEQMASPAADAQHAASAAPGGSPGALVASYSGGSSSCAAHQRQRQSVGRMLWQLLLSGLHLLLQQLMPRLAGNTAAQSDSAAVAVSNTAATGCAPAVPASPSSSCPGAAHVYRNALSFPASFELVAGEAATPAAPAGQPAQARPTGAAPAAAHAGTEADSSSATLPSSSSGTVSGDDGAQELPQAAPAAAASFTAGSSAFARGSESRPASWRPDPGGSRPHHSKRIRRQFDCDGYPLSSSPVNDSPPMWGCEFQWPAPRNTPGGSSSSSAAANEVATAGGATATGNVSVAVLPTSAALLEQAAGSSGSSSSSEDDDDDDDDRPPPLEAAVSDADEACPPSSSSSSSLSDDEKPPPLVDLDEDEGDSTVHRHHHHQQQQRMKCADSAELLQQPCAAGANSAGPSAGRNPVQSFNDEPGHGSAAAAVQVTAASGTEETAEPDSDQMPELEVASDSSEAADSQSQDSGDDSDVDDDHPPPLLGTSESMTASEDWDNSSSELPPLENDSDDEQLHPRLSSSSAAAVGGSNDFGRAAAAFGVGRRSPGTTSRPAQPQSTELPHESGLARGFFQRTLQPTGCRSGAQQQGQQRHAAVRETADGSAHSEDGSESSWLTASWSESEHADAAAAADCGELGSGEDDEYDYEEDDEEDEDEEEVWCDCAGCRQERAGMWAGREVAARLPNVLFMQSMFGHVSSSTSTRQPAGSHPPAPFGRARSNAMVGAAGTDLLRDARPGRAPATATTAAPAATSRGSRVVKGLPPLQRPSASASAAASDKRSSISRPTAAVDAGGSTNGGSSSSTAANKSATAGAMKATLPPGLLTPAAAKERAEQIKQLLSDEEYKCELLQKLPGVDPDDASVQAALRMLQSKCFLPFNAAVAAYRKPTALVAYHEALFAANAERSTQLLRRWAY